MLRLSICFSLIVTLGLVLTACGGGGSGGGSSGSSTPPPPPVTSVSINGSTFNLASCHDFSTTPVGALFERPNMYRVTPADKIVSRIYEQVTGTTVGGVAIVGWFDGAEAVWAVDTEGAIRQIGEGVRTVNGVTVTLADVISQGVTLPMFLPGGTLVNGQKFSPRLGFGRVATQESAATATITLNVRSRDEGIVCIKVLIRTPIFNPHTLEATFRNDEIWIPSGMGVLRQETHIISDPTVLSPGGLSYSSFVYQAPSV